MTTHTHHHHLTAALSAAGDVFRDAVLSLVGPPHPPHWEAVLADYDRTHPHGDSGPDGAGAPAPDARPQ